MSSAPKAFPRSPAGLLSGDHTDEPISRSSSGTSTLPHYTTPLPNPLHFPVDRFIVRGFCSCRSHLICLCLAYGSSRYTSTRIHFRRIRLLLVIPSWRWTQLFLFLTRYIPITLYRRFDLLACSPSNTSSFRLLPFRSGCETTHVRSSTPTYPFNRPPPPAYATEWRRALESRRSLREWHTDRRAGIGIAQWMVGGFRLFQRRKRKRFGSDPSFPL